ncbi:MAG: hypothetical protein ACPKQO_02545 [Nitrososphaeraceae archaeon]
MIFSKYEINREREISSKYNISNYNKITQYHYYIIFIILSCSFFIFFNNNLDNQAFAITTKPLIAELNYTHFLPSLSSLNQDNQVKVMLNYLPTNNSSNFHGQQLNAVMKVYAINGTLLKTSSFPDGFVYDLSKPIQLVTMINNDFNNIIAVTQITNLEKTQSLSNHVSVKLALGESINK